MARKKKNQVVKYNKNTGMTFKDATNWLVPKRLKKVGGVIKNVKTKISEAVKRRADAKVAAKKPMDDYIAKKGPIPTRPMAKSGEMDVELTERIKDKPQGGPITHTKDTRKVSPDKATGGYKPSSVVAKTQKKTLHGGKLSSSQKKLDTLAKEKEKIRNSNMTTPQKKDAMTALNKKKESANIRASGQKKSSEYLKTEEGQEAYQKKVQAKKGISKKRKDRKKDEDEVNKYISHLKKR